MKVIRENMRIRGVDDDMIRDSDGQREKMWLSDLV